MIRMTNSSKLSDGVWTLKESAMCVCGTWHRAEGTHSEPYHDADRLRLIRHMIKEVLTSRRRCHDSHHGVHGLDAIDGTI